MYNLWVSENPLINLLFFLFTVNAEALLSKFLGFFSFSLRDFFFFTYFIIFFFQVSLDILRTIVLSSYPLSESIVTQAFPAAIHCILNSDDNTILQVLYFV